MAYRSISRRSFLQISAMTLACLPLDWGRMAAIAATIGPKKDYPVVIIGAGLGGLCCGAYLAKLGIPVTIVEQHFIPGGYATSFDRASGKFTFEVSLEGTSIHDNSTARLLKELGVLDKIQIVAIPEVLKMKGPGFEIDVPQRDPQGLIVLLTKQFPAEKEGIRGVIQEMVGLIDEATRLEEKKG
ncbi:MAG: FAD-dependent oxidoreductase, partial [Syntrophales bacterium]